METARVPWQSMGRFGTVPGIDGRNLDPAKIFVGEVLHGVNARIPWAAANGNGSGALAEHGKVRHSSGDRRPESRSRQDICGRSFARSERTNSLGRRKWKRLGCLGRAWEGSAQFRG